MNIQTNRVKQLGQGVGERNGAVELDRRLLPLSVAFTLALALVPIIAGSLAGLPVGAVAATAVALGAFAGILIVAAREHGPAVTLAPAAVPDLLDAISLELERSRRLEQPLALVRIPRTEAAAALAAEDLCDALRPTLRAIDASVPDGDSLYLVLPATDSLAAAICVDRLAEARPDLVSAADATVAAFPVDGVTVAGLLAVLDGAAPAAPPKDLPSLDRRRRITVDLTTITAQVTAEVDA